MGEVTITIPATVLRFGQEPNIVEWSFARSVNYTIDGMPEAGIPGHPLFNNGGLGIRAGIRLQTAINNAKEGETVKLDPFHGAADKRLLREAMDSPGTLPTGTPKGLVPPLAREMPDGTKIDATPPGKIFLPYLNAMAEDAKG